MYSVHSYYFGKIPGSHTSTLQDSIPPAGKAGWNIYRTGVLSQCSWGYSGGGFPVNVLVMITTLAVHQQILLSIGLFHACHEFLFHRNGSSESKYKRF